MVRMPVYGQQDRHLLSLEPVQIKPQEDLHWPHGSRLRVRIRFLPRDEVHADELLASATSANYSGPEIELISNHKKLVSKTIEHHPLV